MDYSVRVKNKGCQKVGIFSFAILCGLVASVCTGAGLDKKKHKKTFYFLVWRTRELARAHHYSKDRPPRLLR